MNPIKQGINTVSGMATSQAPITSNLGPDEAAAALAFATHLAETMLPQKDIPTDPNQGQPQNTDAQPQQTPTEKKTEKPQEAPQEESKDNSQLQEMQGKIEQLSKDLRGEMDSKIAKEIGDIKKLIQDALNGEE